MKSFAIVIAAHAAFAAPAAPAADAAVFAPTIVDNVAPYLWSGPAAFDTWIADLARAEASEGKTDGVVWFGGPVDEAVSGGRAFVVTPCVYTYKQRGRPVREEGMTSFTLVKQGGGWKVGSWAWASPAGVAVK